MTMHFREIAEQAAADGAITPVEILALRREGWTSGRIEPSEAEALFVVNDKLDRHSREWSDFFVEALGEFIINGVEPTGYVDESQAEWLIGKIDHDGKLNSMTELELLIRLFERAQSVPDRLREFALEQIERAVLTGQGPTRCGGSLGKGNVTGAEAKLMRRIIFSSGSERPAAVSHKEADLLYRIKDATLDAENSPEWKRLFVQGVGNYLMGFSGHTPLSRERAGELESFMDDHSSSIGGFFGRMAKHTIKGGLFDGFGDKKPEGPGLAARVAEAREVDTSEQTWLEGRIDGNARVDEFDQALLDFIAEESSQDLG
ncbi:MAG: hypothetical protein R3E09_01615 [Novosphingobium sp.]